MKEELCRLKEAAYPSAAFDRDDTVFLDITTDGHYWRTSTLLTAALTFRSEDGWFRLLFTGDPSVESDEYSILEKLVLCPPKSGRIVTFNGVSFLLPYLSQKLHAYDLPDPFSALAHTDLYLALKPLYYLAHLPSRRMADYLSFRGISVERGEELPYLTRLMPYLEALTPSEEVLKTASCFSEEGSVIFSMTCPSAGNAAEDLFPRPVSVNTASFYLILTGNTVQVSSRLYEGSVRVYYPDYKNYDYLPKEGYAVHHSVSSFLPKERRVPADRDTAYTYFPITEAFFSDRNAIAGYLSSVLRFLRAHIGMKEST